MPDRVVHDRRLIVDHDHVDIGRQQRLRLAELRLDGVAEGNDVRARLHFRGDHQRGLVAAVNADKDSGSLDWRLTVATSPMRT